MWSFSTFGQILLSEMPLFSTKNPNFTKNIIKRLNVSVKLWAKARWKAEGPHKWIRCWKIVKKNIFGGWQGPQNRRFCPKRGFLGPLSPPRKYFFRYFSTSYPFLWSLSFPTCFYSLFYAYIKPFYDVFHKIRFFGRKYRHFTK